jgi:ribose/xylose/arabinose/galactoside ABC-type transport system permease subunit
MRNRLTAFLNNQQSGLILIILALGVALAVYAPTYTNRITGEQASTFLNASTLMTVAKDASFFAIMAVGATVVIISGGIDLSVGSIYALSGVTMGLVMQKVGPSLPAGLMVPVGILICCGVGVLCGLLNGVMVSRLGVHPFIITLGTMFVYRGIAFVTSKATSILVPRPLTEFIKADLGWTGLYPVPVLVMIAVAVAGSLYLNKAIAGRYVFAIGGNAEASRYSGVPIPRTLVSVYAISGLCAGLAAFLGGSFYGAVVSGDGTGYELFVIASAVVGGASLTGGRGSAFGAMLGAILIVLMRQSITTMHFDQNYESIIIGCAIIIAVVLDRLNAQVSARRMAKKGADTGG